MDDRIEFWEETLSQTAPDTVGGWATAWFWRSALKRETAAETVEDPAAVPV